MVDYIAVASKAVTELIEEDEEEENKEVDMGEGFSTEDSVSKQVPVPGVTTPAAPRSWVVDPSDQVARRGLTASSRAPGKVPAVQAELLTPAETGKELACQLQVEELAVEEAHQGRDAATLKVVMESAGQLICGQLEGLGAITGQAVVPP